MALDDERIEQHKRRLGRMPWLYFDAPAAIAAWARPWQAEIHARLRRLEAVRIDDTSFVAEGADVIAEPGRTVVIGPRSAVVTHDVAPGAIVAGVPARPIGRR